MSHPHANSIRDSVSNGSQWRHDRSLTNAANPVWMIRVGYLQYLCVYHWQVGTHRNTIIEEARVLQSAIFTVDVFLVQCPADTLSRATLKLTFNIGWVNGFACILNYCVACDACLTGFRVYFYITDMCGKRNTSAVSDNL